MEMEMDMEDEMEAQFVFEAPEIDPDYEFDAAMFFDFTREESPMEACDAERWFERAPNYPPSPFVANLVLSEENLLEDAKSKDVERRSTVFLDDYCPSVGMGAPSVGTEECSLYGGIFTSLRSGISQKVNRPPQLATELTNYSRMLGGKSKVMAKKLANSRGSTLMKPTASMLAKQNHAPQNHGSRFQMLLAQKDKSLCNPSVEIQATKRQKLEGGLCCKIGDAKQQDFIHKEPKKDGTRLRITIPKEPDLETANRAQRMRPKDSKEVKDVPMVARRFKARPLNRKILEAPSLPLPKKSTPKMPEFHEFHLKTSERATQHANAASSSSHEHTDTDQDPRGPMLESTHGSGGDEGLNKHSRFSVAVNAKREYRRPSAMDVGKLDSSSTTHVFKARPLNKKILTSRGDLGIYRNNKRETTVPTEFSFQTEKRMQYNLPIELFNKLSLTSELHPTNESRLQLPRPSSISSKGPKENRLNALQTEHKMTQPVKERPFIFGGQHTQHNNVGNQLNLRSLGIR